MNYIDMFCGAGGTSEGISEVPGCQVTFAINHSVKAIEAHKANHCKTVHLREDIRKIDPFGLGIHDAIWASAECTHFSGAAGGKSRDADSRSLPFEITRYAKATQPAYIQVENVREFLTWGPLTEKRDIHGNILYKKLKGKLTSDPVMRPDPSSLGETYRSWVKSIQDLGYVNYEYRLLNSADYGAHTSRIRYIGIFSKEGYPIVWPKKTHDEHGKGGLPKWLPCKEKMDLTNEGISIFGRKRPLAANTLRRIAYGINKYVTKKGERQYIMKYYNGSDGASSLEEPLHTITTKDRHALVSVELEKEHFVTQHMHGCMNANKVDKPLGTIVTKDLKQLITVYKIGEDIVDIKMRFLTPQELKEISGFPADYVLPGSKKDQIKAVGNAVPPPLAAAVVGAIKQQFDLTTKLKVA